MCAEDNRTLENKNLTKYMYTKQRLLTVPYTVYTHRLLRANRHYENKNERNSSLQCVCFPLPSHFSASIWLRRARNSAQFTRGMVRRTGSSVESSVDKSLSDDWRVIMELEEINAAMSIFFLIATYSNAVHVIQVQYQLTAT